MSTEAMGRRERSTTCMTASSTVALSRSRSTRGSAAAVGRTIGPGRSAPGGGATGAAVPGRSARGGGATGGSAPGWSGVAGGVLAGPGGDGGAGGRRGDRRRRGGGQHWGGRRRRSGGRAAGVAGRGTAGAVGPGGAGVARRARGRFAARAAGDGRRGRRRLPGRGVGQAEDDPRRNDGSDHRRCSSCASESVLVGAQEVAGDSPAGPGAAEVAVRVRKSSRPGVTRQPPEWGSVSTSQPGVTRPVTVC